MPEFCPKCGNIVADGTERCPACGARMQPRILDDETGFTWPDFLSYSLVGILFGLAAIVLPLLALLLCLGLILVLGPGG